MLEALREEVCEQNLELPLAGLVVGSGGNVSGRDPETGLIVIKPSGRQVFQADAGQAGGGRS